MKQLIKKPVLLLSTLGALVGLGLVPSQKVEVKAQTAPKWCDWHDLPWEGWEHLDGCKWPLWQTPCFCDDQC